MFFIFLISTVSEFNKYRGRLLEEIRYTIIKKNISTTWDEMFTWEKNVPPKRDPGFMKVGSMLGGITYFHINRF